MKRRVRMVALAGALLVALCVAGTQSAQADGWSFSFYGGSPGYGYGHGAHCHRPVFVPPPPPPCYHPPVVRYRAYYGPYGPYSGYSARYRAYGGW